MSEGAGASRINLVERGFALLTETQLRRGVHRGTRELKAAAIDRYLTMDNEASKPFAWTRTADEIPASVPRLYHRISDGLMTLAISPQSFEAK